MGVATYPQHHPSPRELDDLELLVTGAAGRTFDFNEPGSPLTLALPEELQTAEAVELVDPEGLPLALVRPGAGRTGGWTVEALTQAQYGPFRRLYLTPAQARDRYFGRTFVPVVDALTDTQLEDLRRRGPLVLLTLAGTGTPDLSAVALIRATLTAAAMLPAADVVVVPLAAHGDADTDHALGAEVVGTYAAGDPVRGLVDGGDLPPQIAEIVDRDQPAPDEQGLVLFFTGLSGSGKSTLARALMDRLLEAGQRSATSLDGDVVRRQLSAGMTFSKADRETNIARIGWVAAEVSRHGGVAVCSPIAPFDSTRQQVRGMVEDAGGAFFLVHVATPLEECERRDRKGLYAKARRGEIPDFTGISSPYEVPDDANIAVDTTGRTIEAALEDVLEALAEEGYVDLTAESEVSRAYESEERALGVGQARSSSPAPELASALGGVSRPGEVRSDLDPTPNPSPALDPSPLKVLFVCTANICRSPYMELASRRLLGNDASIEVSSAGTHGFTDQPMSGEMIGGFEAEAESFRSRRATARMIANADLVLTAQASHRAFLLDEFPATFRKVFTLGQFADGITRLGEPLPPRDDLLAEMAKHRHRVDLELDVGDPYRQGPEVSAECAALIDELLATVIPAIR